MLALLSSRTTTDCSLSLDLKTPSAHGKVVYSNHKQIYQDVEVVRPLTQAKFPVFLVKSKMTKLNYVMKVFIHRNGHAQLYYKNESRFASLRHQNVIRHLFLEDGREVMFNNAPTTISYTMMEYCQNGNFFDFIKDHKEHIDDKLIRTYFKQLIEGLDYLHNSGVSHMDIKLDNLLIDQDYNLKITDFDMAHFKEDAIIISNGTKYFRAPEVIIGRCNNPRAADIYSAGITLFTMKTSGVLPQFEKDLIAGIDFAHMLKNDTEKFWAYHLKAQKHSNVTFDQDFKDLFVSMTKFNCSERASIEAIKASKWYNGPCYTPEEMKMKMERIFSVKKLAGLSPEKTH